MARHPEALLLDLDGTLLDESRLMQAAALTLDAVVAAYPYMDGDALLTANGVAFAGYWREVEAPWTLGEIDSATVSREIWRRAFEACGVDDEAPLTLAQETFLDLVSRSHRLFEEAGNFLVNAGTRFKLALITNGPSDLQREKLRTTEIEQYFDTVLISGEHGIAKPDPRIFHMALEKLGVAPEAAWHVGDYLAADVAGARAAGVTAVWLNRHGVQRRPHDPKPDIEVRTLEDLQAVLAEAYHSTNR